jgi:hypothetical protein
VDGAASSSATAAVGSSPSQDKSFYFLQSTQAGCQPSTTSTSRSTRETPALTSLTGLPSRSGRRECWRYRPVPPRQVPPPTALRPLLPPQQQWRVLRFPEQQGAGAPSTPRALQQWGLGFDYQWLPPPCPTCLPRPVRRLGWRYLLQARKLSRQQINLRHEYSATLVKTAYLLRCGLCDLQFLRHALAGRVARPPRRRGQTSL